MLVPKHLQEISETIEVFKKSEVIKIKCKCNNSHFMVYMFCEPENVNVKHGFNEVVRENDKLYLVKRNFFGKIVERIERENMFEKKQRKIVKIKCEKCGIEHIVFDNYIHGYDSVIAPQDDGASGDYANVNFKKVFSQPLEVYVKIYQDISFPQFKDEFETLDYDNYLNSFGNIDIWGLDLKSKKVKVCSEETS